MSSDISNSKADLSRALSSLDIGSNNELNNEEKEAVTNINSVAICAACGKEGGDNMNTCNKCDLVKYCNAACKKKHRKTHKKKCERRVAELYDERLFDDPPPPEDCPNLLSAIATQCEGINFRVMLWETYLQWLYICYEGERRRETLCIL